MPADHDEAIRRYYASDHNLRVLDETCAKYAVPRTDFATWTLDTLDWTGDDVILDIGAGSGNHYSRLIQNQPNIVYYALDLSANLLSRHPGPADRLALGDALELPYADDSFDVVMANHVLYHLRDIDSALVEIKRVLKPDGRILASTDSLHTTPELQVLIRRAVVLLSENGSQVEPLTLPCASFAL